MLGRPKYIVFQILHASYMLDLRIDLGSAIYELLKWHHGKKSDAATIVADRFIKIFKDHGIAVSEIPRLVPMVSLGQLHNKEALISTLTPEVLRFTASLFGIQQEWLEGNNNAIYKCHYSYKYPRVFMNDVRNLKVDEDVFPVVAFCANKKLNAGSERDQSIVLVAREKCAQLGDKIIYRYHIHDEFYWGYWKTRIQLRAMIRVWHNESQATVPIYLVDQKILTEITEGHVVPELYYRNKARFREARLEDYSLLPSESVQSKEEWGMDAIFDYIQAYRLEYKNKKYVYSSEDLKAQARFR